MKVVHLIDSLGPGGAERSLVELLPAYASHGIESQVVTLKTREEGFESDARDAECPVRHLPGSSMGAWIPEFRRHLKRERPDLVHTTLLESDLVGRIAAVGTGVPVLSSLVNTTYDPERGDDPHLDRTGFRVVRAVDGFTARHLTAHLHAITHAVKESYASTLGIPRDRITVVPRGRSRERLGEITPGRRRRARRELGISEDRSVLVNVGRQEYQKGQRILVEAFARLRDRRPDALLLIAGRAGHETSGLRRAVSRHRLEDRVRLLGHRDDVTDVMAASDLFVFPSLFEGLGGSAIEAMGLGLPVVASDIPVLRQVIGGAGAFARPGDPASLEKRIVELLEDPRRRGELGRSGASRFERRFEISKIVPRMIELYRSVVRT